MTTAAGLGSGDPLAAFLVSVVAAASVMVAEASLPDEPSGSTTEDAGAPPARCPGLTMLI
jgi:hypothetical protein